MTDKELLELIESIRDEAYKIIRREVNRITSDFKTDLKRVQDERSLRGEIRSMGVNWNCSDCVLSEIQISFIPYIEGKHFAALKDSLDSKQVKLHMVPDLEVEEVKQDKTPSNKTKKPKNNI
jgi:hypothetical protein